MLSVGSMVTRMEDQRLSASVVWEWQRAYYRRQGRKAFSEHVVPFRITTNPRMADLCCALAEAFWRDLRERGELQPGAPLVVIDLGAGTGRLAHLLLQRLPGVARGALGDDARVELILLDLSEDVVAGLRAHPRLAEPLARGELQVKSADLSRDELLPFDTLQNPPVVIANYLFDSLPVDFARLQGGSLSAAHLAPLDAATAPSSLDDLGLTLGFAPWVDPPPWLVTYTELIGDGTFPVPAGAVAAMTKVAHRASGRALFICHDKGYFDAQPLQAHPEPVFVRHGCVSTMVNFHLLGHWLASSGGAAFLGARGARTLGLAALAPGLRASALPRVADAVQRVRAGPDLLDLHQVTQAILANQSAVDVATCVSLLRLSGGDPDLFVQLASRLRAIAADAAPDTRATLVAELARVHAASFPLGDSTDVAFELGTVAQRCGALDEAIELYVASTRDRGEHPACLFNLAACLAARGRFTQAELAAARVLELEPSHPRAQALLRDLRGG